MSAPDSTTYQFNFKVGDVMHNIYATNGAEADELLDYFHESLLAKAVSIQQALAAANTVAQHIPVAPAAQQPAPSAPVQAPTAVPQANTGDQHVCNCGIPMRYVQAGVSKATGKPYRAFYACAQPRGQQCDKKITV